MAGLGATLVTRKRQQDALLWESEARYRELMEESVNAIVLFNPDTMRVLKST